MGKAGKIGALARRGRPNGIQGGMTSKITPAQFVRQVRQEVAKVTWPSRKETLVTTTTVFAMVMLAALFFFVVDKVISYAVRTILGFGG